MLGFLQGGVTLWVEALAILLLLACSALISGSEIAYFSLSDNDLYQLEQEKSKNAQHILDLLYYPRRLLATILITNNFVNIAIVILSELLLSKLLPPHIYAAPAQWITELLGLGATEGIERILSFLITVIGVTFLLVLFGEVAPKVYARFNHVSLSRLMVRPLRFLRWLFHWPSWVLVRWTKIIEAKLESRTTAGNYASREEFDEAIELTVNGETTTEQEVDILKSIVKFGDVSVKQIMRPRVDVIALDLEADYTSVMEVLRNSGYSRLPVYEGDFDHVKGILYAKDLLGHLQEAAAFNWQALIREDPYYVPESKKIDALLQEFQLMRQHMAIVVDEYGGSSGIVTLEDILEEVIGEIKDEFDDEIELEYTRLDDHTYLFDGKTLLNDLCRVVGVDTTTFDEVKGESDSVAGLLLEMLGRFPGKDVEIPYGDFRFKVLTVTQRRIVQIQVTYLPPAQVEV